MNTETLQRAADYRPSRRTRHLISPAPCIRAHTELRNEPNSPGRSDGTTTNIISQTNPIPPDRSRRPLPGPTPRTPAKRKIPNEPNSHPSKKKTSHIRISQQTRFHSPIPSSASPFSPFAASPSPGPFAPLVILAFLMLRVRFAPSPTGLLHIGLEALGRETCLRRILQAIGKLKTS